MIDAQLRSVGPMLNAPVEWHVVVDLSPSYASKLAAGDLASLVQGLPLAPDDYLCIDAFAHKFAGDTSCGRIDVPTNSAVHLVENLSTTRERLSAGAQPATDFDAALRGVIRHDRETNVPRRRFYFFLSDGLNQPIGPGRHAPLRAADGADCEAATFAGRAFSFVKEHAVQSGQCAGVPRRGLHFLLNPGGSEQASAIRSDWESLNVWWATCATSSGSAVPVASDVPLAGPVRPRPTVAVVSDSVSTAKALAAAVRMVARPDAGKLPDALILPPLGARPTPHSVPATALARGMDTLRLPVYVAVASRARDELAVRAQIESLAASKFASGPLFLTETKHKSFEPRAPGSPWRVKVFEFPLSYANGKIQDLSLPVRVTFSLEESCGEAYEVVINDDGSPLFSLIYFWEQNGFVPLFVALVLACLAAVCHHQALRGMRLWLTRDGAPVDGDAPFVYFYGNGARATLSNDGVPEKFESARPYASPPCDNKSDDKLVLDVVPIASRVYWILWWRPEKHSWLETNRAALPIDIAARDGSGSGCIGRIVPSGGVWRSRRSRETDDDASNRESTHESNARRPCAHWRVVSEWDEDIVAHLRSPSQLYTPGDVDASRCVEIRSGLRLTRDLRASFFYVLASLLHVMASIAAILAVSQMLLAVPLRLR